MQKTRDIELLAPARDVKCAVDAILCGADAVYMGAPDFGARHQASNSVEDIAYVAKMAHIYKAKLYITLNTILFEEELSRARELALKLEKAGADAFIVQDMAYMRMGLSIPLHASTQCSSSSRERVGFLAQSGFSRVVLERALSISQIRQISQAVDVELEAFVHGALCVSESGKCYFSRATSLRSGNRGTCSQPCRLSYDLENGSGDKIMTGKYLLSMKDLNLSNRVGEMLDAGISSFKIEGRLKDSLYIRNVVSFYRHLLDEQIAKREDCRRSSMGISRIDFVPDLRRSFSRDFTEYFFDGKTRGVASLDTPKSKGEYIGKVVFASHDGIRIENSQCLVPGDGICFGLDGEFTGTYVNSTSEHLIRLQSDAVPTVGTKVYRNFSQEFSKKVLSSQPLRKIPIRITLTHRDNILSITFELDGESKYRKDFPLEWVEPKKKEKNAELLKENLSKLGNTPFEAEEIVSDGEIGFVAQSLLSVFRREMVEYVISKRIVGAGAPYSGEKPSLGLSHVSEFENVTNSQARQFYLDHGAKIVEQGLDMLTSLTEKTVLQSDYCIRREIGECLRQNSKLEEPLYLVRGNHRFLLNFDCRNCRMSLIQKS